VPSPLVEAAAAPHITVIARGLDNPRGAGRLASTARYARVLLAYRVDATTLTIAQRLVPWPPNQVQEREAMPATRT
jgi:hypothetical protein